MNKLFELLALFKRVPIPEEMKPAFKERIKQIGAQTALILPLLSAILVSCSYFFDRLLVEPQYHSTFLYVRLICSATCLLFYAAARTTSLQSQGIALSFITLLLVGLTSSVLIHIVGYTHSYYAMLNIIYLGAMVVPLTWELCLSACLIIFLFYLVPIPFLAKGHVDVHVLANNAGFQIETIIVAVLYSHFHTRKRAQQFLNEQLVINQRDMISQNLAKINELQESRQQFIQNITHDLKTPLSIIAGHIELVRTKLEDVGDQSVTTFRFMADAVQQSTRLLDQLTSIAMLDSGMPPSDMKYYDYSEFIRQFCGRFSLLGEQYRVAFEAFVPAEQLVVRMDLSWMERIIGNLIQNAFKHTPKGGIISVKVARSGENVVTEVRDTGTGIPSDKISLIFERKYQASEEDHKVGFGLGLNIVRNMVDRMNGHIEVSSAVGRGSIFTVILPLAGEYADALIAIPYPESTALPSSSVPERILLSRSVDESVSDSVVSELQQHHRTGLPTILVCEDTPGQLYLLIEALRNDYNLFIGRNGEEGLAITKEHRDAIDLIISDVRMPVMDGIEFCRRFFADEKRRFIPFILLTAYANEQEHFSGLSYGATDYLQKPFNQRILREKINHWLTRRKQEQLLEQMIGELEKKNEMVSRFRSMITHEIRNPLTALYGVEHYLQVLRGDLFESMTATQKRYWTTVEKTVNIAEHINAILDTVKSLEQSVAESTSRPEPVNKMMADIMDQVAYFSEKQTVTFENQVPQDIHVLCDIGMVRQIMINLVRNAVEAVREAGRPGEVSIGVAVDGPDLLIRVVDTGAGITEEQRKNLYKYRATTKKDGNGIGLYLSMKLLQLQNGKISCESEVGRGTTFTVRLPLSRSSMVPQLSDIIA